LVSRQPIMHVGSYVDDLKGKCHVSVIVPDLKEYQRHA
jgi:hypothetical protein